MRSKLFVPGSRPELFSKAAASQADALSFDLEDSVPSSMKAEARRHIADFLSGTASSKLCIVRVNPLATALFREDIHTVLVPGLHVVNVPKVESREDVLQIAEELSAAEEQTSATKTAILANIETPRGLRNAFEIASAHPRIVGLQIGFVDLSRAAGIHPSNTEALNHVRLQVRLASSEAGVAALDGAFPAIKDVEGFRAECAAAQTFGLNGKSCIHPSQIGVANEIFAPGTEEVTRAQALVMAAESATAQGIGAFLFEGEMVDAPIVERARMLLARAKAMTEIVM